MPEIKSTDTVFYDSPDAGSPHCSCSRCKNPIPESDCPIRYWPGDYGLGGTEFRYCMKCVEEEEKENRMNFDFLKQCTCSICSGKIESPQLVPLPVKVPWVFPTWGNFISGLSQMGIAVVCENCCDLPNDEIKYTVEFRDNKPVYYLLEWENETICKLKTV